MYIKKHVGKIKSSDQRCVIVFMQLPDEPEKALIINIEALQPRYEQMLLEVVDSPEGQQARDLANTMGRRMVPETGRTVLEEFHLRNLMRAESIDNIIMLPRPNTPFALRDILEQMGSLPAATGETATDNTKFNRVAENIAGGKKEEKLHLARNLILEAEMLENEANKKRQVAYTHAPSLRPQPEQPFTLPKTVTDVKPKATTRAKKTPDV